jgi:hypothetical protein
MNVSLLSHNFDHKMCFVNILHSNLLGDLYKCDLAIEIPVEPRRGVTTSSQGVVELASLG